MDNNLMGKKASGMAGAYRLDRLFFTGDSMKVREPKLNSTQVNHKRQINALGVMVQVMRAAHLSLMSCQGHEMRVIGKESFVPALWPSDHYGIVGTLSFM